MDFLLKRGNLWHIISGDPGISALSAKNAFSNRNGDHSADKDGKRGIDATFSHVYVIEMGSRGACAGRESIEHGGTEKETCAYPNSGKKDESGITTGDVMG